MSTEVQRYREKLKKLISTNYSARLMSNTKWREVFLILSELEAFVAIAWIHGGSATSYMPLARGLIEDWGIADPGIGSECGPFYYEEIECLVVPRKVQLGKWQERTNELARLSARLAELGELPIEVQPSSINVQGYVKA